jgi:ribosomal protein S18 acetylase RimI-like enzyme
MNFNIRKATVDDADGMAMVHVTSWQQTYRGLIHPDFINERTLDKSKRMFLSTQCKNTIVIETMGQIVGFCGYGTCRDTDMTLDTGEIWGMYILSSYHGRGWGKHLMNVALMELRLLGFKKASLWVLSTNQRAIDFYRAQGFMEDGMLKEVVMKTPVKEIRMIRLNLQ